MVARIESAEMVYNHRSDTDVLVQTARVFPDGDYRNWGAKDALPPQIESLNTDSNVDGGFTKVYLNDSIVVTLYNVDGTVASSGYRIDVDLSPTRPTASFGKGPQKVTVTHLPESERPEEIK